MSFEIELGPPGPEALAVAVKELRETEENVKNGLAMLKKLLAEDSTIYYSTDDDFLMIFLRPCKFYPVSAFELMRRVAEFKDKNASLFDNLMPSDERTAFLEHNVVNVLKGRDHKGRRVMAVNSGKTWDPSKVTADQILRLFYLIHDVAMLEPETQIYGTVVIMDFDGLTMKQVMGLTPSYSMKLLTFIQDAIPLRLKEVHFVKQPFLFNMVWQMFKPFVREKLKKRMFFHGNKMASLHEHIPKTHLPKNYGGDLPEIDYTSADWYPTLIKCEDRIKEWNSYGLHKNK
ncbi:retinaldehyde-binding protein 1 [Megalopta genalis]|uniref:retinaldehyde-binding protein 1 n=1 Tax=Megalopta genalis TaxID=115081 RepID=UPI0014430851|nr:clavesin-1 isoform X1 [Megalopta genalis]XP_033334798.1 clavesin-1 isoform X2 [Megalopta genalis]